MLLSEGSCRRLWSKELSSGSSKSSNFSEDLRLRRSVRERISERWLSGQEGGGGWEVEAKRGREGGGAGSGVEMERREKKLVSW